MVDKNNIMFYTKYKYNELLIYSIARYYSLVFLSEIQN